MKNYDLIVVGPALSAWPTPMRLRAVAAACSSSSATRPASPPPSAISALSLSRGSRRAPTGSGPCVRAIPAEIAPQAGIEVVHRGLWLTARRASAEAVLHAFLSTSMGERCELLTPAQAAERHPALRTEDLSAVLYSPHELRVESRTAIARLAQWLEQAMGVDFRFGEAVLEVAAPRVRSARASYHGERVVVCNNADPGGLFAGLWAPHRIQLCQLQMLRVRPQPGLQLKGSVMGT